MHKNLTYNSIDLITRFRSKKTKLNNNLYIFFSNNIKQSHTKNIYQNCMVPQSSILEKMLMLALILNSVLQVDYSIAINFDIPD